MDIFPTAVENSVINTCLTVAASVLISTLSAYGFARRDFPGREAIFKLYLFTLMMPSFLNILPQFLVLRGISCPGSRTGSLARGLASYSYTPPPTSADTPFSCGTSSAGCRIRSRNR